MTTGWMGFGAIVAAAAAAYGISADLAIWNILALYSFAGSAVLVAALLSAMIGPDDTIPEDPLLLP